jgi:hypothetical protein
MKRAALSSAVAAMSEPERTAGGAAPAVATDPADPAERSVMSGAAWEAFCDALRGAGRLVTGEGVPAEPRLRAEGFRYLTRFLAAGIAVCVEHADPDQPEFCRMIEASTKWGLDMPDCLYLFAPVRGDAAYRIRGDRGSANHFDVQVNFGHFASGDIGSWGTISSRHGGELDVARDGSVEIVLSPDERPGNWLRLAPGAEFVLIRQYFADWENERPAQLAIEREGAPASAPPPRTDQIAARLARLAEWLTSGGALWERMSRGLLSMPANSLVFHDPGPAGARAGLAGQSYGMGNFRCAPDEAVILEFPVPRCRHWSVSLADYWFESLDYASRQSSLNGHQAEVDADGVFRGVIAQRDPGVPNWLDTTGLAEGTLAVRFLLAENAAKPSLRAVPLAELRRHLPADTRTVAPTERGEILRRRRRAVWARFRR